MNLKKALLKKVRDFAYLPSDKRKYADMSNSVLFNVDISNYTEPTIKLDYGVFNLPFEDMIFPRKSKKPNEDILDNGVILRVFREKENKDFIFISFFLLSDQNQYILTCVYGIDTKEENVG